MRKESRNMKHSADLEKKLKLLSDNEQAIAMKLLGYISMKEHSRRRIEELIKNDIQEIVWKDGKE